ncbi:hypothetical protein [Pleionea sp. CnH1-48]|uniref:hypothetical protein n=1 Tax=Pleionea sp. CnH1-48 TaxID=2954494 RepID=UPI002096E78D|nr:hypothetical protein [Pleionea sp. CnH1-48]MCO7226955.1 hypothetical protein [Pleionea sp. CnH1-48]
MHTSVGLETVTLSKETPMVQDDGLLTPSTGTNQSQPTTSNTRVQDPSIVEITFSSQEQSNARTFETTLTSKTTLRQDSSNLDGPDVNQKLGATIASGSTITIDPDSATEIDGKTWYKTSGLDSDGWIRGDKIDTWGLKPGTMTTISTKTTLRQSNEMGDGPNVGQKQGSSISSGTDIKVDFSTKKTVNDAVWVKAYTANDQGWIRYDKVHTQGIDPTLTQTSLPDKFVHEDIIPGAGIEATRINSTNPQITFVSYQGKGGDLSTDDMSFDYGGTLSGKECFSKRSDHVQSGTYYFTTTEAIIKPNNELGQYESEAFTESLASCNCFFVKYSDGSIRAIHDGGGGSREMKDMVNGSTRAKPDMRHFQDLEQDTDFEIDRQELLKEPTCVDENAVITDIYVIGKTASESQSRQAKNMDTAIKISQEYPINAHMICLEEAGTANLAVHISSDDGSVTAWAMGR